MQEVISIQDLLADLQDWLIIDVRSPSEYFSGHIPGAHNIPLFTDEERATVGTLYKQTGAEAAFREGLNIVGPKMNQLVDQVQQLRKKSKKKIVIHCWRGGKRSGSIQWLFNFADIPCSRLQGGYKSFRTAAIEYFNTIPNELKILGGFTGSGKTEMLADLELKNHQVIDLEKLANHKGSAFGSIGEPEQPSNEQFENNLFLTLLAKDPGKPVWIENESKSIGKVYVPDGLWFKMKDSVLYHVEVDAEQRLDRIIRYYADNIPVDVLKLSFEKIRERLGGLDYKNAIHALEEGDLRLAASIALRYYDKAYAFQMNHWNKDKMVRVENIEEIGNLNGTSG